MTKQEIKEVMKAMEELVEEGFLCQALDADGNPIYRNGHPAWVISEKGREMVREMTSDA
jgi:hypothetical protein